MPTAAEFLAGLGPDLLLHLGEASGDALDSSGNGNDGTVTLGSGTRATGALDDEGDGSLSHATTTLVSVPNAAAIEDLFTGSGYFGLLVNIPSLTSHVLLIKGNASSVGWYLIQSGTAGQPGFNVRRASGFIQWLADTGSVTEGEVNYIGVWYDADSDANNPTMITWNATNGTSILTNGVGLTRSGSGSGAYAGDSSQPLRTNSVLTGTAVFDEIAVWNGSQPTQQNIEDYIALVQMATGDSATGSGAAAQGAAASSGTGYAVPTGTGAVTQGVATASGVGYMLPSGSGAVTQGAATADGVGAFFTDATGSGAATQGDATATGVGYVLPSGAGVVTQGPASADGVGVLILSGSGAATQGETVASGAGTLRITATGSATQGAATASGTGVVPTFGSGAATQGDATATGVGYAVPIGIGVVVQGAAFASGIGNRVFFAVPYNPAGTFATAAHVPENTFATVPHSPTYSEFAVPYDPEYTE